MALDLVSALLQPSGGKKSSVFQKPLSTGLSLLNLAVSGDSADGVGSGSVVWVSGPPDSGRSTVGLTLLAEAVQNVGFTDYTLVLNDTEAQNLDLAQYFGKKVAGRVKRSYAISNEVFWQEIKSLKHPFVYLLDSLDGLESHKGWKVNNEEANPVFDYVRKRNSILILTSQEKNIESKKVVAGGFAVPFYADYCLRTTSVGPIVRKIGKKERVLGTNTSITVVKSPAGIGKITVVPAPVFSGSGYDNAESLFMYLRRKNIIEEKAGTYKLSEFGWKGSFDEMIAQIREGESFLSNWIELQ